ncbi:MAG: S8 family serine peptidase [Thermoanaerobaculia bacterium]
MNFHKSVLIALMFIGLAGSLAANEGKYRSKPHPIKDQYIVALNSSTEFDFETRKSFAKRFESKYNGVLRSVYRDAFNGFSIKMKREQAEMLAQEEVVAYVEEDSFALLDDTVQLIPYQENDVLWYLDRTDLHAWFLSPYDGYFFYCKPGTGSRIYIVDNGVRPDHDEFAGRIDTVAGQNLRTYLAGRLGMNCFEGYRTKTANDGHGTAVASIAAGTTRGVAKDAIIVDARACYCNGQCETSIIVDVLDWIISDPARWSGPSVVNMSFNAAYSEPINAAVARLTSWPNNITVVVSAGNHGGDSGQYSPSSAPSAITVGAMTQSNVKWPRSNSPVDIYAPGQNIEGAHVANTWGFRSTASDCFSSTYMSFDPYGCLSGTSFAAPMVAGAAARWLQSYPDATPQQVLDLMISMDDQIGMYIEWKPVLFHRDDYGGGRCTFNVRLCDGQPC